MSQTRPPSPRKFAASKSVWHGTVAVSAPHAAATLAITPGRWKSSVPKVMPPRKATSSTPIGPVVDHRRAHPGAFGCTGVEVLVVTVVSQQVVRIDAAGDVDAAGTALPSLPP